MNVALKVALLEKGITQMKVSASLGWDPSKFSKMVNGWVKPKSGERKALSEFLKKPESELFPGIPEQEART